MKSVPTILFAVLVICFFSWAAIGRKEKVAALPKVTNGPTYSDMTTTNKIKKEIMRRTRPTTPPPGREGVTVTEEDRTNFNNQNITRNRNTIIEAQRQLYSQGFIEQAPTGVMDADTVEGLNRFQKKKGINATGRLDNETLNALGIETETGTFAE